MPQPHMQDVMHLITHAEKDFSIPFNAKIVASLGLHCISSTLKVCDIKGVFCVVKPIGVLIV
jgi:hypothetical protein